jgi:hypothetical protein
MEEFLKGSTLSTSKTSPRYLLKLEVHTRLPRDH